MKADRQLRFAELVPDTCVPDATPTRPPFTRTATLFGALRASLFETRMLLADFCNETRRTDTSPGLSFPRRDDGHDHLPFLTRHARPLRVASKSGEERRAAHHPFVSTPVPVPPACAGLPDRDTEPTAPLIAEQWRDARVSGLSEGRVLGPLRRLFGIYATSACAWRMLTTFPSSFFQRTPVVVGASACMGTSPAADTTDRPRLTFLRQPAKATGIP